MALEDYAQTPQVDYSEDMPARREKPNKRKDRHERRMILRKLTREGASPEALDEVESIEAFSSRMEINRGAYREATYPEQLLENGQAPDSLFPEEIRIFQTPEYQEEAANFREGDLAAIQVVAHRTFMAILQRAPGMDA